MVSTFPTQEADMARSLSSPFDETIESFIRSRHDLKMWTLKTYQKSLRRLGCKTLADFTAYQVDAHIARKLREGKRHTAHHDGVAAKQLGQWLVAQRILTDDPVANVHPPKQPKKGRPPFTEAEVRQIRAAAKDSPQPERDELMVVIALACGLRLDELRRIQWPADIDLREQMLWVREGKTDAAERAVVLDPQVCSLIDAYVMDWRPSRHPGALFLNQHGDDFSYDGFSMVFRRIRRRLPPSVDFKVHRCRNTAIVNWWRAGVHPWDAQQMAGHKTAQQTREYAKYTKTPAELRRSPAATAFTKTYGRAG